MNYHTTYENREDTRDCDAVQIMLSGYRKPSADGIKRIVNTWGIKQKLVFHMDYYRTPNRYLLMHKGYRDSMIEEIAQIVKTGVTKDVTVLGLVIHTDALFSKEAYKSLNLAIEKEEVSYEFWETLAEKYFTSKMYQGSLALAGLFQVVYEGGFLSGEAKANEFLQELEKYSIKTFFEDLERAVGDSQKSFVFLENTTKSLRGESLAGSFERLKEISKVSDLCSICFDEEHAYASGWKTIADCVKDGFLDLEGIGLVHLNTIPEEVGRGSYLDRHSDNTISESKESRETYCRIQNVLNDKGISYIREVNRETREREIWQYNTTT